MCGLAGNTHIERRAAIARKGDNAKRKSAPTMHAAECKNYLCHRLRERRDLKGLKHEGRDGTIHLVLAGGTMG